MRELSVEDMEIPLPVVPVLLTSWMLQFLIVTFSLDERLIPNSESPPLRLYLIAKLLQSSVRSSAPMVIQVSFDVMELISVVFSVSVPQLLVSPTKKMLSVELTCPAESLAIKRTVYVPFNSGMVNVVL